MDTDITRKAYDILKDTDGKFCTVKFVKKDMSVRILNGRTGVKKNVNGNGKPWKFPIVCMWDVKNDGQRAVDARRVISIKSNKEETLFVRHIEDILDSIDKPASKS